ncbi:MAG: Lnb N-terminal periplasmic domain-containing protein [Trichloromonadaceae bacterium]
MSLVTAFWCRASRSGCSILLRLAFVLLLSSAAPACHAADSYLTELREKARQLRLHEQRSWQILLHYQPTWRGVASLIDDPQFFLAAKGKSDPAAELEATLAALFAPPLEEEKDPRCRFVARRAWLGEALQIDQSRLPQVECRQFDQALAKVDPQRAVLIFPGYHLNSPASMFGHTLISIEGPYQSKLLAYAVNYAAFTDETNGFAYAVKGLLGLYPGYFSILPYYEKVKEYSDLERRDLWEYELDLTPDEVGRMLLHVWELREIASDYFFFGENCSYNLLFLLEAARPSLNLTDGTRPWVIPVDTVRLAREAGLIKQALYRPSKAGRISRLAARMTTDQQDLALRVSAAGMPAEGLPPEVPTAAQARILDLATEQIEYRYFRQELTQEEYQRQYREVLAARAKLGRPTDSDQPDPIPERPDLGHGSNRLALGGGVWKRRSFAELKLRPAFHHLQDPDAGYLEGSQIDFLNLVLRAYPEEGKAELHALDLVNIVSLAPRDRIFQPVSWKVATGFVQKTFADRSDHLVYNLNPGGGFAWHLPGGVGYLFAESAGQFGGRFRDNFTLGGGSSVGLLLRPHERWKLHFWGRQIYFLAGDDPHREGILNLDQTLSLNADNNLSLAASRGKESGVFSDQLVLSWNVYW